MDCNLYKQIDVTIILNQKRRLIKPINRLTLNTLLVDEVGNITAFHAGSKLSD